MIAWVSRSTILFLPTLLCIGIRDCPRTIVIYDKRDARRRFGERIDHSLRPFEHNKIPRILQELVEAERRKVAPRLETIRVNVHEPFKYTHHRKHVDLFKNERRTIHGFFNAEGLRHCLRKCRLPRPELACERDERRTFAWHKRTDKIGGLRLPRPPRRAGASFFSNQPHTAT